MSRNLPHIVGLLVAWGGAVILVSPVFPDGTSIPIRLLAQTTLWTLFAAVLVIVLFWERQPLSSLWLRPVQWQSFAWAGLLLVSNIVIVFPITEWIRQFLGLAGYADGMTVALADPVWLRLFGVVTAGIVEETLFRGYAVTRLLRLSGSVVFAIVLSSLIAAALHLPVWGPGPSLSFFIGGLATTAFFAWRRDLLAMIVFHVVADAWGLVITPAFSEWWK